MRQRGSSAQIHVDVADEPVTTWDDADPDDTRPTTQFPVARDSSLDEAEVDLRVPLANMSSGEVMVVPEPESLRDLETMQAIESADTVARGNDPRPRASSQSGFLVGSMSRGRRLGLSTPAVWPQACAVCAVLGPQRPVIAPPRPTSARL